jgi:two-component system, cell cycle sensor histidine kinase and response regulator CckA
MCYQVSALCKSAGFIFTGERMEHSRGPTAGASRGGPDLKKTGPGILVMDDDQFILMLANGMLEHLGYPSVACCNGHEAIRLYQSALEMGDPFFAAIMDLEIPGGMGGKEAAERILCLDPAARLVVSSGNGNDPVVRAYQQFGFCYCMPKPYGIAELARMLATLGTRP